MKCPSCNHQLERQIYHGLIIDTCRNCKGIWFASGKEMGEYVAFLRNDRKDIPFARIELEKEVVIPSRMREATRLCPRCARPMSPFNYAYDSNIFLDKCPACGGVWTDGGEIFTLASCIKGNPRLDALGRSVAEETESQETFRELVKLGDDISTNASWWVYMPKIILPLGDESSINIFPWAVLGIILANVLSLLFMFFYAKDTESFVNEYAMISSRILLGGGYLSFVSSMFLHWGLLHLIANMFFFFIFAPHVEEGLGHLRFLLFYLLFGLIGGIVQFLVNIHSTLPAIGSSGAIAGVMGAYFMLYPNAKIRTLVINRVVNVPAYIYLGGWVSLQVIYGIVYLSQGVEGGVAWFAHIGGFVSGLVLAWPYRKKRL